MTEKVKRCHPKAYVDKTLAIIKPEAVKYADVIEDIILRTGFTIVNRRRVHMTPEQASDFYSEHFGKMFFTKLVEYMSQGPIICLIIARDNAITTWEELMGPTNTFNARETYPDSIRAVYGTDDMQNAVHGSENMTCAEKEIKFFFPDSIPDNLLSPEAMDNYMSKHINPTLLKGLTQLCKAKPIDPITYIADWLIENNPNKPQVKHN
ncbi:nucleoside diphosphate kinase homolog 5 [Octopus sinensis]|uniref:Nucleoside diphosphate kinase homolog 5 n=1 Tax=Octopus sinensis TaxID=2607531 RepID=A0A6P7SGI0_9MOLL|nr:nucleoside diphosphate kinase homolog 5 [Octopus sinensis]